MTLHKLFKELQKLNEDDVDLLLDARREAKNCKRLCDELGVKYTDKRLAKFLYEREKNNCNIPMPATPKTMQPSITYKKIEQIICGTNLDIIEDAAEKKGLL